MLDLSDIRAGAFRAVRWTVAGLLVAFTIPFLVSAYGDGGRFFAPFLLAFAGLLIAPELLTFFHKLVTGIMFPTTASVRTPNYGIPESLVARGHYADAEKEYEAIMDEFPDAVKPHADLIEVATARLNNAELAEKLYQRGLQRLRRQPDREHLTKLYEGLKSYLKTPEQIHPAPMHFEPAEKPAPGTTQTPNTPSPRWTGPKTALKLQGK